jgi:hypothetical protein
MAETLKRRLQPKLDAEARDNAVAYWANKTAVCKLQDGDVYRWRYKEPGPNDGAWGRYHCCSQIAIAKDGWLRDTYWHSRGDTDRTFGPDDLSKLELTFLGNLSELERAEEWKADYYADADIVNLNHANSSRGNFYLRKGAQRSADKMLEVARYKLEREESVERSAQFAQERLRAAIAALQGGDTSVHL